jgi:hydrogenase expression/formation protein HypD
VRYVDEFRDPKRARVLLAEIRERARPAVLMEVCGGHTHAIYKHGLPDLLPPEVELVHGPGCPVCVVPRGRIADAIALAETEGVTLATFGDMLRVPGTRGSLLDARARGADVRMVYSPLDALAIARDEPDRQVCFLAIGFETTAPSTAITLLRARDDGVPNFSVLCNHVRIAPALRAILDSPDVRLDGLIGPGHVSTVIGADAYGFVASDYGRPVVVSGFEPLDLLQSIAMLLELLADGLAVVRNQYTRAVLPQGNRLALEAMARVFEVREEFEWRGLGTIPDSAFRLRDAFADLDAERRFALPGTRVRDPKACRCGDVLRGVARPRDCKVFGTACTPERPLGTCMVSAEGACAAYWAYGRNRDVARA